MNCFIRAGVPAAIIMFGSASWPASSCSFWSKLAPGAVLTDNGAALAAVAQPVPDRVLRVPEMVVFSV